MWACICVFAHVPLAVAAAVRVEFVIFPQRELPLIYPHPPFFSHFFFLSKSPLVGGCVRAYLCVFVCIADDVPAATATRTLCECVPAAFPRRDPPRHPLTIT